MIPDNEQSTDIFSHLFQWNKEIMDQIIMLGAIVKVLELTSLVDVVMWRVEPSTLSNGLYRVAYTTERPLDFSRDMEKIMRPDSKDFPHISNKDLSFELIGFKRVPVNRTGGKVAYFGYSQIYRTIYYVDDIPITEHDRREMERHFPLLDQNN